MEKILVIPDIHGKLSWINLIDKFKEYDLVIFLGDYFDSFNESIENQIKSFQIVCSLIKENPEKFIGLLGNHDMHYLKSKFLNLPIQCSGFQSNQAFRISLLLEDNLHLFKASYQRENFNSKTFLFSHAGITTTFIKSCLEVSKNKPYFDLMLEFINDKDVASFINLCLDVNIPQIHFCGRARGGNHSFSGPFWTGLKELENDSIQSSYKDFEWDVNDFVQIVGHTRVDFPYKGICNNYFVDSLTDKPEIIKIDDFYVLK